MRRDERDPLTFVGAAQPDGRIIYELGARIRAAHVGKRYGGKVVEVEIREFQEERSARQNRGFHAMVKPWANQEGHRIEDLKRDLLKEIFGVHESVSLVTGEVTEVLNEPHTSKLKLSQFCELIDRTLEIAAWAGVQLVAPDEYRRQKEQQAKKAARTKAEKARAA